MKMILGIKKEKLLYQFYKQNTWRASDSRLVHTHDDFTSQKAEVTLKRFRSLIDYHLIAYSDEDENTFRFSLLMTLDGLGHGSFNSSEQLSGTCKNF